jgi:hypothetical protein
VLVLSDFCGYQGRPFEIVDAPRRSHDKRDADCRGKAEIIGAIAVSTQPKMLDLGRVCLLAYDPDDAAISQV